MEQTATDFSAIFARTLFVIGNRPVSLGEALGMAGALLAALLLLWIVLAVGRGTGAPANWRPRPSGRARPRRAWPNSSPARTR